MSANKVKDAVVKLREYKDRDGNKKVQWANVGSLMRGDDGNEYLLLDRHFNPAGILNPDSRNSVLITFFDVKRDDKSGKNSGEQNSSDVGGEIPF